MGRSSDEGTWDDGGHELLQHGALVAISEYYQQTQSLGTLRPAREATRQELAGALALCPPAVLSEVIGDVDLVLVMSVNPGFGGQAFIPNSESKIQRVRQLLETPALLFVD